MNERKRENLVWQARDQRKKSLPNKEQEEKHLKSLAKLHLEFTHLRTCKELKLANETAIHWSDTYDRYILCGVSYTTYSSKGDFLKIEILHKEGDWFRVVVIRTSRYLSQKSNDFDCNIRFKNLLKFITFVIPILKED